MADVRRKIISAKLKTKMFIRSAARFRRVHISDTVKHDNKKWIVSNANWYSDDGEQGFDLSEYEGKEYRTCIRRSAIKKVYDFRTIKNSITYYYRWWRSCWYQIELNDELNGTKDKWYEYILRM